MDELVDLGVGDVGESERVAGQPPSGTSEGCGAASHLGRLTRQLREARRDLVVPCRDALDRVEVARLCEQLALGSGIAELAIDPAAPAADLGYEPQRVGAREGRECAAHVLQC